VVVVAGLLSSPIGLLLKALGNNPTAVNLFGKNSAAYRALGLAFSNGLTGFSGALMAQVNGYVDISMGIGIVLIALGTVVMGSQICKWMQFFRPFHNTLSLVCCFLGIVIYFFLMHLLLSMGLDPIYLRLAIGVCLISFLALTHRQQAGVAI
jgi:putative ABC transport system permease protein